MRKNRALLLLPALLVLLSLALAGCKDFSFYGVLGDRIDDTPLQISPAAVSVAEGGTLTFTATGGKPPYSFARVSGTGSIDAGTGLYTAPPTAGSETVRVTDSKGRRSDAAITVTTSGGMLAISPDAVSMGPGGSLSFIATGGTAPYTFSLTASGSGSPLINDGGIPGAYVAGASTGTDTIQVQDSALPTAATATATVNVTSITNVDYAIISTNFPANGTGGAAIPGGADFTIQNVGSAGGSQPVSWWVYLSDDATLGSGDLLQSTGSWAPLGAGATADIPLSGTWPLTSGVKSLFVMVAAADDFTVDTTGAISVTIAPPDVDYRVAVVNVAGGTTTGGALAGNFTLANNGASGGTQPVTWTAYVSTNATWDAGDAVVDAGSTPALAAAPASLPGIAFDGTWPAAPNTYFLIVAVSASDEPSPADTVGNEVAGAGIAVQDAPIDYEVTGVSTVGTTAGGVVTGSFTLRNHGTAGGGEDVFWTAYASFGNATLELADPVLDAGVESALGATASSVVSFSGLWPATPGTYYLIVKATASDEPVGNTIDNTKDGGAVTVAVPDYKVPAVNHTAGTATGVAFTGSFTLRNDGGAAGGKDVTWTVYASLGNAILELGTDTVADAGTYTLPRLAASGGQTVIGIDGTWPSVPGNYYLIVSVAAADDSATVDNLGATGTPVSVTNQFVDYTVTAVNNTGTLRAGGDLDGNFSVKNIGLTNGAQNIFWQTYASFNNNSLDAGDALVASGSLGPLNAAQEVTGILFSGTWPGATGPYYLIVTVGALDESNSGNNAGSSAQVTLLVPIVNYTVGNVNYTGPSPAAPATAAPGTFRYSNGLGLDNGSQWVNWTVFASQDTALDAYDVVVASGSAPPLNAGTSSGDIPFNGVWPLTYGNYYLFVRLSVPEDVDPGNNTDRTATQAPVGVYNAIVQNGDCVNLLNYTDLTGVVLKPGMSVKVVSAGFPSTHDDHLFRLNVGTASTFTASWVLDNTAATEDIGVYWYKPGPPGVILGGYWIGGIASITLTFPVHPVNDAGQNRWIDLYSDKNKNLGSYVLYITAN